MSPHAYHSQRRRGARESCASPPRNEVDVVIEDAGAICLFHLVSDRAEAWVRLRDDRGWYTLVGALVVDHTHTETFAHWMRAEGLNVGLAAARGRV